MPKPRFVAVKNESRLEHETLRAKWCAGTLCKLKGFMFRNKLNSNERLLLVEKRQGRLNTAIHMMAVFMPLGVLWIDSQGKVVDTCVARPWRFYLPKSPAQYVLEGEVSILDDHAVGDKLQFVGVELSNA
jgi:uncharacterized membrane protein (UPF0127 family)